MFRYRTSGFVAVLFLIAQAAFALNPDRQLNQYRTDIWVPKDGLPRTNAWAITQTPDGYLWLGTSVGLVRFNGASFRLYNQRNTPGLTRDAIYSLAVAPSGNLWIGTDGSGFGVLKANRYE